MIDWLIDAAFTIDLWNRSSTVSIAHKTYVKPTKRIFYSIMITMITQSTLLLYIYMRYDIVYSYTVYTIYIYISYINIQYMYTIYMYYMNHDMIYNRLHNIQYNIHALKIHLLCWPSLSCHGAEMTGFASCLWPWRLDRVGPRFQWCNVHVVSEIKTIVNDIHVILLYPSIP